MTQRVTSPKLETYRNSGDCSEVRGESDDVRALHWSREGPTYHEETAQIERVDRPGQAPSIVADKVGTYANNGRQ